MFKVFDRKKNQVDLLENPISPVIVNELGGIGELSFSVPSTYKHLELEGYIQVENDHEYVIKEIVTHGTNREVVCTLNIEEILGMAWSKFISRENTLMKCAELVLSGTGWRAINKSSCTVSRNLYGTVTNSYNLLQMMCTVYNVEFIFDTFAKTVTFVDKVGKDAGVYFINDINLKQLNIDTHTHKYITRVIPIGKEGLTIESVNGGKNYLENKTYSNKNIYGIWQSDKHDNPSALKADAQRFLDEMAIPYETYEVLVDDLYALRGIESFKYELGDVVTIIDGETETRIQQRVIQRTYNLLEPDKDTLHIANKDATFEDYYKRLQTIADMTQSVIGSDGTISGGSISDGTVSGDKLQSDSITSTHIKAEQILADHIMSNQITSNHIVANNITTDHIQANSIDTRHLKANSINANHIQANTINSNHITTGAITAGSGIIADGAIGSAQISSLDAGKISSGTIDTSKITVQGANGHLRLQGNRMQVFDGRTKQLTERVSLGDVNGDGTVFGLRVRGKDGQTVLLDENGVTSEGITDGSITNDKVADNANISGTKLDINSVISQINLDGTEVIQGTKIEVNGTNLGVKLSEITNKQTENDEKITQAQTQITANQNAIKLKVDEQTYQTDKTDMTSKLNKNTSEISTMKDQISLKVDKSEIENVKNELGETIDTKIVDVKAELKVETDKITQNISSNYYNKEDIDLKGYQTASQVQQTVDGLEVKVTQGGGYNLLYNGDFKRGSECWVNGNSRITYAQSGLSCPSGRGVKMNGVQGDTTQINQYDIEIGSTTDKFTVSYYTYVSSSGTDGTTNPYRQGELVIKYTDDTYSWHGMPQVTKFDTWEKKTITVTPTKRVKSISMGLYCRDTTKIVYYSSVMVEKGTLAHEWTPNPNEVHDGITTIDRDGITVSSTGSNTYTQMDDSSFRVSDNNGGTVAEFAKASIIPQLTSGTINAQEIYANNVVTKSKINRTYTVNGSTGTDTLTSSTFRTVQFVLDNFIEDVLDEDVRINISNSVQGWRCTSRSGKGTLLFYLEDNCIVSSIIHLTGCTNFVRVAGNSTNRKATLKEGITVSNCTNFDIGWLTFRGKNWSHSRGSCCVFVTYGSKGIIRVNDFNGVDYGILVDCNSEIWCYNNKGSSVSNYIGVSAYTTINMMRSDTDACPDYTYNMYSDAGHANLYYINAGATFTKTPSAGWSPSYTPTQKTQTWSFNKIWSDETKNNWNNRNELIQGYSSKYDTGQWTGYLQMTDGMAGIKSTISDSTNLSGRIYVQRRTSSGADPGTCCMYASDGTHIGNKSMARGAGAWFTLSSAVVSKIMSGTITYFYLKNNADNINTYMKMETLGKIEITYTK